MLSLVMADSSSARRQATPADVVTTLPLKVPEWDKRPPVLAVVRFMSDFVPPTAPTGNPPPITLPITKKSGISPSCGIHTMKGISQRLDLVEHEQAPNSARLVRDRVKKVPIARDDPAAAQEGFCEHRRN